MESIQSRYSRASGDRVIQLVTGEFASKTDDGKEIEVYRWDPGTVIVNQGDNVELHITGVNGESHPFVIEELGIKGEVTKGKTTMVKFQRRKKAPSRSYALPIPRWSTADRWLATLSCSNEVTA